MTALDDSELASPTFSCIDRASPFLSLSPPVVPLSVTTSAGGSRPAALASAGTSASGSRVAARISDTRSLTAAPARSLCGSSICPVRRFGVLDEDDGFLRADGPA